MAKPSQELTKQFGTEFLKVQYKDRDKSSVARGIILEENEKYVFLKGDYSKICILKESIEKVTSQTTRQGDSSVDNQ